MVTFQAFINYVLRGPVDCFVMFYFNDVLIYSENQEQHVCHVTDAAEVARTPAVCQVEEMSVPHLNGTNVSWGTTSCLRGYIWIPLRCRV